VEAGASSSAKAGRRRRPLPLALAAVAIIAVLVLATIALTLPGPKTVLIVTDGSMTGMIEGDFFETNYSTSLFSYFNATSVAQQPDHPNSILTLQIVAITRWASDYNAVETALLFNVTGDFDSNLSVKSLRIDCNQTAYHTGMESFSTQLDGGNVAYDQQLEFHFWDNDSGSMSVKLVNRVESSSSYRFSLSDLVMVHAYTKENIDDRFISLRATVTGWFEPEFSVGITLKLVNTSPPG
jgi:hypothetical protein